MLKLLARPKAVSKATPSHEELFMQRYERLLIAARHLTGEPGRAEDLVHNAFVQFMLSRPDLESIKNLDGYLLIMLRNMNVSQARRPSLIQAEILSAADYDSAEAGLRALDAHAQLQIRQQLCLICEYACRRKDQSKIGSALILRYFHGYYPNEVAQVLRVNRHQVDHWLLMARQEARAYVEDPASLKFIPDHSEVTGSASHIGGSTSEFLSTLRRKIFLARAGCCLVEKDLREIYQATDPQGATIENVGHVVTCAVCLDEVNGRLGIPLLAERFPMETFGNEPKQRGGPPPGDDEGSGGTGDVEIEKLKQVSRRRLNDTLEHRPKELHVAVNGYLLGSHALSGESNQLALNVNLPERVGFVEVFSEQGFCLMFTDIDGPPDGPLNQKAHAELSDGRTLELNLSFGGLWPTINVAYVDPHFGSDPTSLNHEKDDEQSPALPSVSGEAELSTKAILRRVKRGPVRLGHALGNWGFWLRPGIATAVVALLALATFFFLKLHRSPNVTFTTTAELLSRASAAEEGVLVRTDQVLHRTISLEEKNSAGAVIARRKIEVWHSGDRGITARRLYDERGALVAGDWRRADGVQTIYHHGSRPQLLMKSEKQDAASLTFENVWHLDPSAIQFSTLIGQFDGATVETRASDYFVTYNRSPASVRDGLLKATLVLSRADLHAMKQTLTIQHGSEAREYSFVEASFERHTPASVAPAVFDPDPELLVPAAVELKPRESSGDVSVPFSPPVTPVLATAEVEVEALRLLNQVGADLNDQTTVTRTTEGKLRIAGLVDSDQRKEEIVRALAPLRGNPAVVIEIQTVAEALRQQQPTKNSGPTTVEKVEVTRAEMPVYADLKKYFAGVSGQGATASDESIREFAARILNRSRRAMSHAGTLKRLGGRFSEDDLRNLTPEARAKWLTVIRSHARAFEQETRTLRQELQPIFFPGTPAGNDSEAIEISDDATMAQAIQRLLDLGLASDEVIRSSFSISPEGSKTTSIRSQQFWRSLRSAEDLAAKIAQVSPSR